MCFIFWPYFHVFKRKYSRVLQGIRWRSQVLWILTPKFVVRSKGIIYFDAFRSTKHFNLYQKLCFSDIYIKYVMEKINFFFILKSTNYFISLIQSILNKINSVCVSFLWYSIVWITKLQIYMFSIAYHACECYFLMHAWFDMWSIDACQIWFSFFFVLINAMVLLEFNINWRSESMGKRLYIDVKVEIHLNFFYLFILFSQFI